MKTYDSYIDSGINWLGKIPSHWKVKKLRAFFDEVTQLNSDKLISNQLQFKYGTIIPKPNQTIDDTIWNTIAKYTCVEPDDIIINGLNLNYDFISQRIGKVNEVGIITSAYLSLRPRKNINARFFEYLLKAMDAKKVFHGFGTGVRATLAYKELKHKLILDVPLSEQDEIANHLDKVTREIDKAIEVHQKIIDTLNERKQIIITQAVTRGINPNVPLKDSGINWLGLIPEHWNVWKLKFLANLKSGKNLTSEDISPEYASDTFPVYGGNGLRGYYREFNTDGDYAIIGRQGALCGNINYAHGKFWATDHAVVCYPLKQYPLLWFGELLKVANLNQYATQSAQPGLSVERIKVVGLPYPPYNELLQINTFLEETILSFEKPIIYQQKMIELLRERKNIIINEVVTGKVKVS